MRLFLCAHINHTTNNSKTIVIILRNSQREEEEREKDNILPVEEGEDIIMKTMRI
jgi:hypothetical protein